MVVLISIDRFNLITSQSTIHMCMWASQSYFLYFSLSDIHHQRCESGSSSTSGESSVLSFRTGDGNIDRDYNDKDDNDDKDDDDGAGEGGL